MSKKATFSGLSEGHNLLWFNCEQGNLKEVKKILQTKKKLDINKTNKEGFTSLALAVRSGSLGIVEELIAAGADVNIKNFRGQSPLSLASWDGYEEIAKLLIKHEADVNCADQKGWTPLMIAVYHSFISISKLLINHGADITVKDCYDKTLLDRTKHPELKNIILEQLSSEKEASRREERIQPDHAHYNQRKQDEQAWETTGKFADSITSEVHKDIPETLDRNEPLANDPERPVEDEKLDQIPAHEQSRQQSDSDQRADGFLSFGNRWEMKNQLVEQINLELRSSADYLTKYSGERIKSFVPEEAKILTKKMFNDLSNTMDHLEEQIQLRFEDSINKQLGKILDVLKSAPRSSSPGIKKSPSSSPARKEYSSIARVSSAKDRFKEDFGEFSGSGGKRSPGARSHGNRSNEAWQQEELNNSRRAFDAKNRIQSIKDTLNINFELSPNNGTHGSKRGRNAL